MANNKSASKRNRQRDKRRIRNRNVMGSWRSAAKTARAAIDEGSDKAAELIREAASRIDKAVSKGALKRKTASRYISRLSRAAAPQSSATE